MSSPPPAVVIAGPTCTGKTALAVEVAERLGGEIVNADSRQVRSGLQVGTCAPQPPELRGVPAHLFQIVEPGVQYTAGDWITAARAALAEIRERGRVPVVVGGTGLYLRILLRGYILAPPPDPALRERRDRLAASDAGRRALADELADRDPQRSAALDPRNTRRVIRALEALDAGAAPGQDPSSGPGPSLVLGLDTDRQRHAQWVRRRSEAMLCTGRLQEETATALRRGVDRAALAACGIGYAEALAILDGELAVADALEAAVRRTLRYARSQRTFFKGEGIAWWLEASRPVQDLAGEVIQRLPVPAD